MLTRPISTVIYGGQLLLSGLVLFLTVATNLAGEKIQITGPETIAPPGFKEDIFTNPSDFLRSKPDSGSAPTLAPPSPSINIRPDKLQEDKKWDLNEKFDEEGMLKRALGVRDYTLDSLSKKSKSNWEKLYAETAERKGQMPIKRFTEESLNRDDNDWELLRRFAANRGEKRTDDESNTSAPILELNFFNLLFGNELGDNLALIAGGVVRGPFLPNANNNPWNRLGAPQGDRGQDQRIKSKQFDTLFDSRKLLVNQPADPINGRSDDARREMNPVTGEDYSSGNGSGKPSETFGTASSMRSSLSGPLDSLNSRVSGVPSLTPSATPIPPPSIGSPQTPMIQEIPRRKF